MLWVVLNAWRPNYPNSIFFCSNLVAFTYAPKLYYNRHSRDPRNFSPITKVSCNRKFFSSRARPLYLLASKCILIHFQKRAQGGLKLTKEPRFPTLTSLLFVQNYRMFSAFCGCNRARNDIRLKKGKESIQGNKDGSIFSLVQSALLHEHV